MTVGHGRISRFPPLWRRAPASPWRSLAWALLVLGACTLLGIAAAAPPIFDEASDNASFSAQRAAVPATARASDATVVRLTGSASPRSVDQARFTARLREIAGLGTPVLTGTSVGAEAARPAPWQSAVGLGSSEIGARLFAQDAPGRSLSVVSGGDSNPGVWLPQPLATELHAGPGDEITFVVTTAVKRKATTVPVAGTYAVADDGRTPADPEGGRQWALRDGELPADHEFRTLPAFLVVTDVATAERLAARTGDRMLWTVESALLPDATLAQAREASIAVDEVRRDVINASPVNAVVEVVQPNVITGIPTVVDAADEVAAVTSRRTTSLELASLLLGLASVVGIVVLALGRRRLELQHAVGSGLRPISVAGLWVVEHVAPALLGAGAGFGVARLLVGMLGPDGRLTDGSLQTAAVRAAAAAAASLLVVGVLVHATASATLRPQATGASGSRVPWAAVLVVAAGTATLGLLGADPARGAPRGLDLLVPLLVMAATGTVTALGLLRLAAAGRARRRGHQRRRPWQVAWWIALRRITAPDRARTLVTAATATGLGMLLFALCAVAATTTSIEDRVSVQAGAEAAAQVPESWLLDPGATDRPADPAPDEPSLPPGPIAGVRTPPVPNSDAVVWRYPINLSPDFSSADLLVTDPRTFVAAARWGDGGELARSLAATEALVAADRTSARQVRIHGTALVPVIAVATTGLVPGDEVNIDNGHWSARLKVTALASAYPGLAQRPMFVAPASTMLGQLGVLDPRLRPLSHTQPDGGPVETWLWSAGGTPGVDAVLKPLDVEPTRLVTAAQLRQQATYVAVDRARLYQLALGASLALLAVLSLALQADRAASRDRATDFMLARVGLGRSGVRTARALESAFLAVVALLGAVVGVTVLLPLGARLLEFDPSLPPGLRLHLEVLPLGIVASVAAVSALVAAGVASTKTAAGSEEVALRDTD